MRRLYNYRTLLFSSRELVLCNPTQTTRYLEQLLEVRDAVGPALMLLGDGNWRMGDGIQAKPNKGKPTPGSESVLIAHYTCASISPRRRSGFLTFQL
jgi:hypothetical protein